MKLLFTQDALVNSGAERSHLEILSRFSTEIEVVFVYFYPKHDLKEEYEKAGIRLIFLQIAESYHFRLAVTLLIKVIRAEKPDLLISSLWRADIITRIASVITRVPLVGTLVNDSYAPIAWKDKKGLKYKLVYWLDRLTARIPKYWIANAQALVESHEKTLGLNGKKISVVYRGRSVPETFWTKDKLRDIGLRRDMPSAKYDQVQKGKDCFVPTVSGQALPHRNDGYFNFISYGRLLERKGFQDAIQAFSKVLQKYPNCTLTIYGEGPFRTELEKLVQDLDLQESVFLPGKISNPIDLLISNYNSTVVNRNFQSHHKSYILHPTSYNCFLFPSWYEGFSGALVEAMMSGIPIIASNISMNLEAVSPKTALIFEVQNRDQLANQMIFAIDHPGLMAGLGKAAREEAIARFDIEKIAKDYEALLFEIKNGIKNN
ncbi:glycosyltransferase family 4 protein [Algoriphagus machipongonensis]|uniref:Glycosyl transferase, family 4 n=1 Tax=Algoriphagus machipongonensis TaxID=388413 RepID=A3HRI9_9BACT|nr:glycosyltransferase family 4 protein [Algoriphagus machipongonensis]EAZ82457.1 glycosyl transferase, family 4 [Algoriphagus machipongonensis]